MTNKKRIFPFCQLKGMVVHGQGKGKKVGMPTANLEIRNMSQLPPTGIYGVLVLLEGDFYIGVTNVGTRPSVDTKEDITVETYILDFHKDIYGKEITLYFYEYIRGIIKMDSLEEVKKQVDIDAKKVRQFFNEKDIYNLVKEIEIKSS